MNQFITNDKKLLNLNENEAIEELQKNPIIKEKVKEYLINNIDLGIISDYWLDLGSIDEDYIREVTGLQIEDDEELRDYISNLEFGSRDKYFKTFEQLINQYFESLFDDNNIGSEFCRWNIYFVEA